MEFLRNELKNMRVVFLGNITHCKSVNNEVSWGKVKIPMLGQDYPVKDYQL